MPAPADLIAAYLEQRDALARFCRARLGADGDVEDVLQDVYLRLAGLEGTVEIAHARAYLYRLTSSVITDRWRSARRAAGRDAGWRALNHAEHGGEDVVDAPSPETAVADRQRLARLMAALATLPARTQQIFRLHKFDGLSYAQTAEAVGVSKSSVEKHMMEALRRLQQAAGP